MICIFFPGAVRLGVKRRDCCQKRQVPLCHLLTTFLLCPFSQTDLGGCNGTSSMVVIKDYYALKEDEICVNQGEVVQILAINQQNMFLVYQPANDHSPAAEGWIPGNILAPLTKSTADNNDGSIK